MKGTCTPTTASSCTPITPRGPHSPLPSWGARAPATASAASLLAPSPLVPKALLSTSGTRTTLASSGRATPVPPSGSKVSPRGGTSSSPWPSNVLGKAPKHVRPPAAPTANNHFSEFVPDGRSFERRKSTQRGRRHFSPPGTPQGPVNGEEAPRSNSKSPSPPRTPAGMPSPTNRSQFPFGRSMGSGCGKSVDRQVQRESSSRPGSPRSATGAKPVDRQVQRESSSRPGSPRSGAGANTPRHGQDTPRRCGSPDLFAAAPGDWTPQPRSPRSKELSPQLVPTIRPPAAPDLGRHQGTDVGALLRNEAPTGHSSPRHKSGISLTPQGWTRRAVNSSRNKSPKMGNSLTIAPGRSNGDLLESEFRETTLQHKGRITPRGQHLPIHASSGLINGRLGEEHWQDSHVPYVVISPSGIPRVVESSRRHGQSGRAGNDSPGVHAALGSGAEADGRVLEQEFSSMGVTPKGRLSPRGHSPTMHCTSSLLAGNAADPGELVHTSVVMTAPNGIACVHGMDRKMRSSSARHVNSSSPEATSPRTPRQAPHVCSTVGAAGYPGPHAAGRSSSDAISRPAGYPTPDRGAHTQDTFLSAAAHAHFQEKQRRLTSEGSSRARAEFFCTFTDVVDPA